MPCRGRRYRPETSIVRRGSTVRVRQRALQKARKPAFYLRIDLHVLQYAVGMEPFMELSGPERPSWPTRVSVGLRQVWSQLRALGSTSFSIRISGTAAPPVESSSRSSGRNPYAV